MWKMHSDDFKSFSDYLKSPVSSVNLKSQIKKDLEEEFPDLFRRTRKVRFVIKHLGRKR